MAENEQNGEDKKEIEPASMRQLERLPDESSEAHKARMVYCRLGPGDRSIAAAYRAVKNLPLDTKVKVPGNFSAWTKTFKWKEYAAAWDSYRLGMTADPQPTTLTALQERRLARIEMLEDDVTETAETGRRLHDQLKEEMKRQANPSWWDRLLPWRAKLRLEKLRLMASAHKEIAAALRDTTAADRIGAGDTTLQLPPPLEGGPE